MISGGYWNKYLRVNLTTREFKIESFSEEILRKFIGGSGLGAKIVYDETDKSTDPLGPDNVLTLLTGPFVGTSIPNSGRYHASCKSPVNGLLGEGSSGGTWGAKLKRAGFDGIIFNGKADKPVYLHIDNGKYEIKDATEYWGMDTFELDAKLKELYGKKVVTCCIGPAGENLVNAASIMNDGVDGRTAGRCGVGAVMGSKNLKAVTVIGDQHPPVRDPDALKTSTREWSKKINAVTDDFREGGTSGGMFTNEAVGNLPIKNWTKGNFDVSEISGANIAKTILVKPSYCAQCPIGCGRSVQVKEGKYKSIETGGPEYETLALFGSNLMIGSLEAVQASNEKCNRLGLDTIAAAGYVAFAMECYENGIITMEDLGGREAKWGDEDDVLALLDMIAYRKDIGYLLAEGTKKAAENLGGIAPEFAVHVKGIEFPAHDPRAADTSGLAFVTGSRGACHLNAFTSNEAFAEKTNGYGWMDPTELDSRFELKTKGIKFVMASQQAMAMLDSMTLCKFISTVVNENSLPLFLQWFRECVGWDISKEEWLETGERIFTIKRMYQVKCGVSRKDDVLPPRMSVRRGTGGAAENIPSVGEALDEFYALREWDIYGRPKQELLDRLRLKW